MPTGESVHLQVCPEDIVDDLRLRIAGLQLPVSFFFQYGHERMIGDEQLMAYGVQHGDRIDIIPS